MSGDDYPRVHNNRRAAQNGIYFTKVHAGTQDASSERAANEELPGMDSPEGREMWQRALNRARERAPYASTAELGPVYKECFQAEKDVWLARLREQWAAHQHALQETRQKFEELQETEREERRRKEEEERRKDEETQKLVERLARERDALDSRASVTVMSAGERSRYLCGIETTRVHSQKVQPSQTARAQSARTMATKAGARDASPKPHSRQMVAQRDAAVQQAARCAERDAQWTSRDGFYTSIEHAFSHYCVVSEEFDRAQFSIDACPLVVASVPWPTMLHPSQVVHGCLSWEDIDGFFRAVQKILPASEYQDLLRKARMRFHPDRWTSRRLLESVLDDELRAQLQAWCMMVSQAVNNAAC